MAKAEKPLLTRRQMEVLGLLQQGLNIKDIADELYVSPKTVGGYLNSIYHAFGVHNWFDALRYALDSKMLEPLTADQHCVNNDRNLASFGLTKREKQALALIMQGMNTKAAAQVLEIAKRTVDYHLSNVWDKLEVGGRKEALALVTRVGALEELFQTVLPTAQQQLFDQPVPMVAAPMVSAAGCECATSAH